MILYHHTCETHLESILREGLNRGDVPTSLHEGVNGVWFTTDAQPSGHGLLAGRPMTDDERLDLSRMIGKDVPAGSKFADKTAVRIQVVIPSTDRNLVSWVRWGRKHCETSFFQRLNETGPRNKTWFIYFGVIQPDRFQTVEVHGKPYIAGMEIAA